ncbi:MAG: ABC transporter ATP-binding protein [Blastocatellia bacterium]
MADTILEVAEIEKQFEKVTAVDRLSFAVQRGEIFALLGPNGAGKTTTVRMLTGIIQPDRGALGYTLSDRRCERLPPSALGYLPEERGLYQDTPLLRTLTYFGALRGMARPQAAQAARQWLERLGLGDRAGDKLETLSKGNQQKVQFIAAVLHQPVFAVLDEPFSGLDPVNQDFFLQLIRELRDQGMSVLLSAHQMQLVERLADRILLINRGREVMQGSLSEIRRRARAGSRVTLRVQGRPNLALFDRQPAVESAQLRAEGEVMLLLKPGESLSDLLMIVGKHLEVLEIHSEQFSLHDIYVQAVGTDAVEATMEAER